MGKPLQWTGKYCWEWTHIRSWNVLSPKKTSLFDQSWDFHKFQSPCARYEVYLSNVLGKASPLLAISSLGAKRTQNCFILNLWSQGILFRTSARRESETKRQAQFALSLPSCCNTVDSIHNIIMTTIIETFKFLSETIFFWFTDGFCNWYWIEPLQKWFDCSSTAKITRVPYLINILNFQNLPGFLTQCRNTKTNSFLAKCLS